MRWVVCAVIALALPSGAVAADLDILRGPVTVGPQGYPNWSGVYGGGQIGADFNGVDFRKAATPYLDVISGLDANFNGIPLNNFPRLSAVNTTTLSYGAFVGYNFQFEDAVVGLELNVNRSMLNASISDSQSHSYFVNANNAVYATTFNVNTNAAAAITTYGTVRTRFGWAFHNFLPYVFGGLSVAEVNASSSVDVNYFGVLAVTPTQPAPPTIGGDWAFSDQSHGKPHYGFDVGTGVDFAVTQNLFMRGEVEYIQFGSPNGIRLSAASARLGAGVKF